VGSNRRLPSDFDGILREDWIAADQDSVFHIRLRNQDAIEGVLVMRGQAL
jgi:hypothetical protein